MSRETSEDHVSDAGGCGMQANSDGRGPGRTEGEDRRSEAGIIVFGGGGSSRGGCSAAGCLFWILISVALSVGLTVLLNVVLWLFSGSPPGIPMVNF